MTSPSAPNSSSPCSAIVDGAADAIVGVDTDSRITIWNQSAIEMFGYSKEEIIGEPLSALLPDSVRDRHEELVRGFADGDRDRRAMGGWNRLYAVDSSGREFPVEIGISRVRDGDRWLLVASVRDVSRVRQVEREVEEQRRLRISMHDALPDAMCRVSPSGKLAAVDNTDEAPDTGLLVGQTVSDVLQPHAAAEFLSHVAQAANRSEPLSMPIDGSDLLTPTDRCYEARLIGLDDRDVLVIVRDVTSDLPTMELLQHQANHDGLTGLPNRRAFYEHVTRVGNRRHPAKSGIGLLAIDLDLFKRINDLFGELAGDELLVAVAARLRAREADTELVARVGDDEFVIVVDNIASFEELTAVAHRYAGVFESPFRFGEREARLTASIGMSLAQDARRLDTGKLASEAHVAMRHAKSSGRDTISVFDEELRRAAERRAGLESGLRIAMERSELHLAYQPVFEADTLDLRGYEALLRWNSPAFGDVSPGEFIPVAEESGLIAPISDWVLETACARFAAGTPDSEHKWISVNVSAHQLGSPGFVQRVADTLELCAVEPHRLQLELTETALVSNIDLARTHLARVRSLGVGIAIDDFGTGYASLTYLRDLPITQIKIDREFVSGLDTSNSDHTIVASTIEMAHRLGCNVIAEGVETETQLRALRELGCDKVQGFLLGRPNSALAAGPAIEHSSPA